MAATVLWSATKNGSQAAAIAASMQPPARAQVRAGIMSRIGRETRARADSPVMPGMRLVT